MTLLAKQIDAPTSLLPLVDNDGIGDGQYVEIEGKYWQTFRLVAKERGQIVHFEMAADLDELMYHIFKDVTRYMASQWELINRKQNEDSRRQLFAKQHELLTMLSSEFSDRFNIETKRVLNNAPYKD